MKRLLLLVVWVFGCQKAPPAAPTPTRPPDAQPVDARVVDAAVKPPEALRLEPASATSADLIYAPGDRPGARLIQATLTYPAARLRFVEATPGAAAEAAGKQVKASARAGQLRVVVLSTANAQPVGPGALAHLRFERLDPGPAVVTLHPKKTRLAPEPANHGVRLGPPWSVPD